MKDLLILKDCPDIISYDLLPIETRRSFCPDCQLAPLIAYHNGKGSDWLIMNVICRRVCDQTECSAKGIVSLYQPSPSP